MALMAKIVRISNLVDLLPLKLCGKEGHPQRPEISHQTFCQGANKLSITHADNTVQQLAASMLSVFCSILQEYLN